MQPTNPKTMKIQSCEKGDYEKSRKQIKDHRGLPRYGADFDKIENAPNSRFEREVIEKITVEPDAPKKLIYEEDQALLHQAIKEANLSDLERQCITLNLEGNEPHEIAPLLGRDKGVVKMVLSRARRKLIEFVHANYEI